ncbi:ubiquitin carboxyl-terminal hydrolase 26 isoform X2 [Mercurialis annua]|nr:ubiquitin carboxyl-terminal hydrolase 26 isoform X2 [Mercurialis annua]
MSRPTTRSKNKRNKQGDNVNITSEILRKIHVTGGEVTNDDINQLYMIWKPVCQGCRVNTKDNPNCFCGLIPPPNGSRKSGLWQKLSEIEQAMGEDPCNNLRASSDSPAGLTNLGATCYANSILQYLYMNTSFREGLFSVEPELLKQQPVLDELARLFAKLHAGKMAFIDSAPFIKTLELDNGVQQDSHEFLTLLLSLLERCLSYSEVSKVRTIVQDLFRGSVSHVTTCSKCGRDSEASYKMEDFYELELNVKGLKNLDESLDDYLSVEELHGENQYFCEICKTRVDANRSIKLQTLPDVLNFQLKRCVFLPKTTTKKKITSAFGFPGVLDMRQRLSEPSQLDWVYDLTAVLIHKGTAVNSGHYTAHIRDERTGQWWEFDDEHVSNLGCHPFGEVSSSSSSKVVHSEPPASKEEVHTVSNGNHIDGAQPKSLKSSTDSHEMFSSNDAYMLMYTLRRTKKVADKYGSNKMLSEDWETSLHNSSLPSHLLEDVKALNASYLDACQQYKIKKENEVNLITERRQEVRTILSEAPVQSLEISFCWVSTDWLRQWADNITSPMLDNTPIQCSHGKVPVSKVSSLKRLSAESWAKLLSKYGGGPMLTNNDCCMACLQDGAQSVVCADSYRDRRTLMRDLVNDVLIGKDLDGKYYVSKTWLQQWVRRKNLDAPNEADAGPTVSIRCPHGKLMPEQAPGAKRVLVPEKLWLFFYEDAIAVKPDDSSGCITFPSDSQQCSQCCDEISEEACLEDSLRVVKIKQRQNHEKLSMGKSIPLSLHCKYYLVSSSWLTRWRNYVTAVSKNTSSSVEPETLDIVMNSLKCEKHLRLLERAPDLISKRGMLFQKGSTTDGLTIITDDDWNNFCEEWGGNKEEGISAVIEPSNVVENRMSLSSEVTAATEGQLNSPDDVNDKTDSRLPVIRTCPEICEDCIGEKESCKLMQKLNYSNEDIHVTLIRGKEAPRSILEASKITSEPDRRASKRSRKTSYGNSVHLKVSGFTSIYQLKMMIWESFGVVKENQILHKGEMILDKDDATLADFNVFPGDKLWVQDSEIHEHRDIADELAGEKMNAQHAEEGFRGTLLTASISSQPVQDVCSKM